MVHSSGHVIKKGITSPFVNPHTGPKSSIIIRVREKGDKK